MSRNRILFGVFLGLAGGAAALTWYLLQREHTLRSSLAEDSLCITAHDSPKEAPLAPITIEEAEKVIAKEEALSEPESIDPFADYRLNNEIFMDTLSLCNQGAEPLIVFIERFSNDPQFRESRSLLSGKWLRAIIALKADALIPSNAPDETGLFTSWHNVGTDSAYLTTGWINSEVAEEFYFKRIDARWFLVDYYNSELESE